MRSFTYFFHNSCGKLSFYLWRKLTIFTPNYFVISLILCQSSGNITTRHWHDLCNKSSWTVSDTQREMYASLTKQIVPHIPLYSTSSPSRKLGSLMIQKCFQCVARLFTLWSSHCTVLSHTIIVRFADLFSYFLGIDWTIDLISFLGNKSPNRWYLFWCVGVTHLVNEHHTIILFVEIFNGIMIFGRRRKGDEIVRLFSYHFERT